MHRVLSILTLLVILSFPTVALADGDRCFCHTSEACGTIPSGFPNLPYDEIDDGNDCAMICQALSGVLGAQYQNSLYISDEGNVTDQLYNEADEACEAANLDAQNTNLTEALRDYADELSEGLDTTEVKLPIIPQLSVPIPNLTFSDVILDGGYMEINFLAEYVSALYSWLLYAGFIVAIVMVMVGGVQYVIGSGIGQVTKAKAKIRNAITGLVLLLGTFTILYTVNPQLVMFEPLYIDNVQPIPFEFYEENLESCQDVKGKVDPCSVQRMSALGGAWTGEFVTLINQVAEIENVDPILIATHLQKETGGDVSYGTEIGPCGEIGPAQFMPTTFDHIVNVGGTCCTEIARKGGIQDRDRENCKATNDQWPPTFTYSDGDSCASDICGNCQIAAASCIEFFDTVGNPEGLQNVILAQAKFIKNTMQYVGNDYALEMCAYNGSGKDAAHYAATAANIYADFCKRSGGSM